MATTTAAAAALSMKLRIDKKAQRVLFAEASKDVVDFLFSLLSLPVATAVKLVGKDAVAGCVGNLYASVDELDSTFFHPGAAEDALLRPTTVLSAAASALLGLPEPPPSVQPKSFYGCDNGCRGYITDAQVDLCPDCYCSMTTVVRYLPSVAGSGGQAAAQGDAKGFVQGIATTYTVLDDLTVTPMSAISGITTLLVTFAIRDIADLQEKTVQLGHDEGLAILKASLQSKSSSVLTDVFLLGNKKSPARRRALVLLQGRSWSLRVWVWLTWTLWVMGQVS